MCTALTVLSLPDSWLPLYRHLDKGTLIPTFNSALSQEDVGGGGIVYIHVFLNLESNRGKQKFYML